MNYNEIRRKTREVRVGGLVIGVAECFAAQYLGSNVRDPMAFVILILILIIKPVGLFGKKGISKV